ncbi:MAG TPA: sigma factor [Polyangiaceae bacterium]|jgi:DNA-directed RNA polymerase specialized sigma24 family protein
MDPSLDHEDAPISEPRPSSPAPDASLLGLHAPSNDTATPLPPDGAPFPAHDPPMSGEAAGIPVTAALTVAFLAKKATRDRIREVVEFRVPRGAQKSDIDDMCQDANVRALATTSLAKSVPGMRPWVSRIAQNVVIDFYRDGAIDLKWLRGDVDVQELPPDPAADGEESEIPAEDATAPPRPVHEVDERMLGRWLEANVKSRADKLTLEMLKQKAETGKTNAAIAAEFGMTEAAFDNRILRFKAKWIPKWEQHKKEQRRAVVILVLALLGAAMLWWLLRQKKTQDEIGPTTVPRLGPVPTATASAVEDGPFNQAAPTDGGNEKPERLKP